LDPGRNLFGLSAQAKARLIEKLSSASPVRSAGSPRHSAAHAPSAAAARLDVSQLESSREIRMIREAAEFLGITDPFFRVHEGIAGAETIIDGCSYVNFASYNYLGLNGHPRISAAAKAAIDRYGTSVSASRPVSGERPVHRELELELAHLHGTEDCVALVGGHSTNVTVIGQLLGRNDVIVHDALIHNSIVQGAILSGARRVPFPHLDHGAADRLLGEARPRNGHALLVIEGHYSMDGDVPDLPAFIAAARRHGAWLMVDEAHALGVLGARGAGSCELLGVEDRVDLRMATFSKSLASCGGVIAGPADVIEFLRFQARSFIFTASGVPAAVGAALAAVRICRSAEGPPLFARVLENARYFQRGLAELGLRVVEPTRLADGTEIVTPVVPVVIGDDWKAGLIWKALYDAGLYVNVMLHPAVPPGGALLRTSVMATHDRQILDRAVEIFASVKRDFEAEHGPLAGRA
jgi:8-amino-7-oxononanoate synthase